MSKSIAFLLLALVAWTCFAGGLHTDADGDWCKTDVSSDFNFVDDITFHIKFYIESYTGYPIIFTVNHDPFEYSYRPIYFYIDTDGTDYFKIIWRGKSHEFTGAAGAAASTNTLYNIVITIDESAEEIKFYSEGTLQETWSSGTPNATTGSTGGYLLLGQRHEDGASDPWNQIGWYYHYGTFYEFAIWGRELSDIEIENVCKSDISRIATNFSPTAAYDFSGIPEGTNVDGLTFLDLSGNGHNLTCGPRSIAGSSDDYAVAEIYSSQW